MECSLLYVSRRPATTDDIAAIVQVSRARNASLDVTGALVASRNWFAQILEGPGDSIDELMASISCDERHSDMEILVYSDIAERQFGDWALAYNGSSYFVDQLIEVLAVRTSATPVPYHLKRLVQGIVEFTHPLH
jgi:hypothetical protein